MIDVKAERPGVPRKVVLAVTFGVPAALLFFGGDARQLAWFAALFGMTALYRADLRDVGPDATARLVVTEKWRGRLVLFAGWLALLLAYQGMQGAEEARVLRELAVVCGENAALCERLTGARAVAGEAGAAVLEGGQKFWGYPD